MTVDPSALADAVASAYGVRLVDVTPLLGGYDAYAKTFEGRDPGGNHYFIKVRVGHEPGIALSDHLHRAGNPEVVAPIRTQSGSTESAYEDFVLLLYPFEPGKSGIADPPNLSHWTSLGRAVRRIHGTRLSSDDLASISTEPFAVANIDRFLETMERTLTANTDDVGLADLLREYETAIRVTVARTEVLGLACRARKWDLVISHADLHVGNVLVQPEGAIKIVDWDSPRLAPRECDLQFMCDGGILNAHGPEEEAAFFRGYGACQIDPLAMAFYRHARAVEDFVADTHEATDAEAFTLEERLGAVRLFRSLFGDGKIEARAARPL